MQIRTWKGEIGYVSNEYFVNVEFMNYNDADDT